MSDAPVAIVGGRTRVPHFVRGHATNTPAFARWHTSGVTQLPKYVTPWGSEMRELTALFLDAARRALMHKAVSLGISGIDPSVIRSRPSNENLPMLAEKSTSDRASAHNCSAAAALIPHRHPERLKLHPSATPLDVFLPS